jgi:hypothetical protein
MGGSHAFIGGGYGNTANSAYAVVSGGSTNIAESQHTSIIGGYVNSIDAWSSASSIIGGSNNAVIHSDYALAGGFNARSSWANGAFTWADSQGTALDNTVADRTVFKNRGGFMITGSTNTLLGGTVNRGVFVTGNGLVGISTGAPQAALDVVSNGGYAQIWRDSTGVIVASMTGNGIFSTSFPATGDNLGSHTAAQALNMNGYPVINVSSFTVAKNEEAGTAETLARFTVGALGSSLRVFNASAADGVFNPAIEVNQYSDGGDAFTIKTNVNNDAIIYGPMVVLDSAYAGSVTMRPLFEVRNSAMRKFMITGTGNVGIGTEYPGTGSPTANLHISSTTASLSQEMVKVSTGTLNADVFVLKGNGDVKVSGNVGIGTAAPGAKLDVVSNGGYSQIWRDASGVIVASMSANGIFSTSFPSSGDNLGSHIAGTALDMAGFAINSAGNINGSGAVSLAAGGIGALSLLAGNTLSPGQTGGGVTIAAGGGYNAPGAGVLVSAGLTSTWSTVGSSTTVVLNGGPSDSPATSAQIKVHGKISAGGGSPTNPGGPVEILGGNGNSAKGGNIILLPGSGSPEGYVGIGTANPQAKLHVNGSLELARFDSSGVSGYAQFLYNGSPKGNIGYTGNMSFFSSPSPAIVGAMIIQANDGIQLGVGSEAALNITNANLMGVGMSAPAARLDVQSTGSTPPYMAQLWRDSNGTIVSSVSATGVMTASKFVSAMGGGTGQMSPIGLAGVNLNTQATTSTAEETLLSYTLPANSLNFNSKGVRIKAWGNYTSNANSKSVRIRFGGLTGAIVAANTTSGVAGWALEAVVFRTGPSTQKGLSIWGEAVTVSTPAQTDTAAIDIAVTGETPSALGEVTAQGLMVEFIN